MPRKEAQDRCEILLHPVSTACGSIVVMDQKPTLPVPDQDDEELAVGELHSDSDDEAIIGFGDQSTSIARHRRINRPQDPEAEAVEVCGVLLAKELRLGEAVLVRSSKECTAEWVEQRKLVKVPQAFRSRFPHFGFSEKQDHYLFPEEALFLAETGRMVLKFDSVLIADFQRLYSLLLGRNGCLGPSVYGLYSRLAKRGHRLRRFRRQREVDGGPTPGFERRKKLDPGSCGAMYRWDEYAMYRELLRTARRNVRNHDTGNMSDTADFETLLPLPSICVLPSLANPCRELGLILGLEESVIQQLSNDWQRSVNDVLTPRIYVAALEKLEQSVEALLGRQAPDDERREAFKRRVSTLKRLASAPNKAAIGLLHGMSLPADHEEPPSILSRTDNDRPKSWAEFRMKQEEKNEKRGPEETTMCSSERDWFSRLTVIPDLTTASKSTDPFRPGFTHKFRRFKDKQRMMLEVDPPPKSATEGASWRTMVIPQMSTEEDELTLGDVLMMSGARLLGLEPDGNFPYNDPILIGSVAGDDYDVLSLTTCSIPTPDEVEDVVLPSGYVKNETLF